MGKRKNCQCISVKYRKISNNKDMHVNHCDVTGNQKTKNKR